MVALVAAFFDIGVLSDMVNIGTLSAFTLVAISIPIMRKKRPDLPRAFKMPGSPWIPILIAVANFWLMLNCPCSPGFVSWCGSWSASPSTSATATGMRASARAT